MDARFVAELRAALGTSGVLTEAVRTKPYESDGLAYLKRVPELVVLPRDTRQCAKVMQLCAGYGVPVVPRGAGTGLSGGATPVEGCIVLGVARMRDVLAIDPLRRIARVQAGVVNADLSLATAKHGLFYAPDPSSQKACTLGGNVAENSGGPHCFKHGATTRHVEGLVLVTATGDVIDLSEPRADPAGLDLIGVFVGSEGLFGLATEITVRLLPIPPVTETLLAIYASLDAACEAVSRIIAEGLEPSALEIIDRLTIEAVEASVLAAGYPKDAEAVLLVEVEGSEALVRSQTAALEPILRSFGAVELRRARNVEERARLWAGRKGAFGAMGRIAPDLYVIDAVVPRTKLAALVSKTTEICRERRLKLANVFHAGDGNLHPNISYDRRDPDELARVIDAGHAILRACIESGGALTGEHGIGVEKLEAMEWLFSKDDLAAMCRVKDAWDPDGRMNPGKLVPVHTCMETRSAVPRERRT